jgi:hypothetical protein
MKRLYITQKNTCMHILGLFSVIKILRKKKAYFEGHVSSIVVKIKSPRYFLWFKRLEHFTLSCFAFYPLVLLKNSDKMSKIKKSNHETS